MATWIWDSYNGVIMTRGFRVLYGELQDRWIWGVVWGVNDLGNWGGVLRILKGKALEKILMNIGWSCQDKWEEKNKSKWKQWRTWSLHILSWFFSFVCVKGRKQLHILSLFETENVNVHGMLKFVMPFPSFLRRTVQAFS